MAETERPLPPEPEEKPEPAPAPVSLEITAAGQVPSPEETTPGEPAAAEIPAAAAAESRSRRFFRLALRWAAFVAIVFALGVLAAYFLLYRPLLQQADQRTAELSQARQELATSQKSAQDNQTQVKALQTQVVQAQTDLAQAQNQAFLQSVLADVANARLALANKDGPAAQTALKTAQTDLNKLLPAVKAKDSAVADALTQRLSLALNELTRDPKTAISDLDVLTRNLQDLQKLLFP